MKHQRGKDLRHVGDARLTAVKCDTGVEVLAKTDGELVDHTAAETKADRAELTLAVLACLEPFSGRDEIFGHLLAVDGAKRRRTFLIIARITADRGQPVGSERHIAGLGEAAGDVFDIGVEPAIFVNDEHDGKLFALGRLGEIALDRAVAGRRIDRLVADLDVLVLRRHGLRPRVIGRQALKDRRHGEAADGKLCRVA